jgi:hypothetical protein
MMIRHLRAHSRNSASFKRLQKSRVISKLNAERSHTSRSSSRLRCCLQLRSGRERVVRSLKWTRLVSSTSSGRCNLLWTQQTIWSWVAGPSHRILAWKCLVTHSTLTSAMDKHVSNVVALTRDDCMTLCMIRDVRPALPQPCKEAVVPTV